jgi:DNA-binding NtrC family response regulator
MNILVVEDEPNVLSLLIAHFQSQGHQVAGYDSGEGAVAHLQQHPPPEALLVDVFLKGKVDGLCVLRHARQANPRVKAIVITGSDEVSSEAVSRLDAAFLKKPIRLEDVDRLVN